MNFCGQLQVRSSIKHKKLVSRRAVSVDWLTCPTIGVKQYYRREYYKIYKSAID